MNCLAGLTNWEAVSGIAASISVVFVAYAQSIQWREMKRETRLRLYGTIAHLGDGQALLDSYAKSNSRQEVHSFALEALIRYRSGYPSDIVADALRYTERAMSKAK
jgi:hypothetical protein